MKTLLYLSSALLALALPAFAQDEPDDKKPPEKKEGDDKKKAEEKKEPEPVSPGAIMPRNFGKADLQPKLDTATVKVIVPRFGGPQPVMVVTEVTAEIIEEENAPEMQATFELKPKLSIDPMINVMSFLPKKHKANGWPKKKAAHFIIDEIQADSAPTNFSAAVLIDAMLLGIEIPENVVLFSALDKEGKITRGGDKSRTDTSYIEAIKITADAARPVPEEDPDDEGEIPSEKDLPRPDKTMYLITGNVPDATIDDLIIDQSWDVLNSTIVLRCKTHDEAMQMIQEIGSGGAIGKTITDLAEAQKLLRDKSIRNLTNDAVWSRVVSAGKALPGNATAFGYARLKTRKVSETYSLDRCLAHIHTTVGEVTSGGIDKFDSRELRKFVREKVGALKMFERKIHPEATPVMEAGVAYVEELKDYAEAKKKAESKVKDKKDAEVPERATEAKKAAQKAYNEARAAAVKKL